MLDLTVRTRSYGSKSRGQKMGKRGKGGVELEAVAIVDYRARKYKIEWIGGDRSWVHEDMCSCSRLIREYWETKTRSLKRRTTVLEKKNRASMSIGKDAQSSLLLTRKTLANALDRSFRRAKQIKDMQVEIKGLRTQLELSEVVVLEQEKKLRSVGAIVPGEIIMYDAGTDEYTIKDSNTLTLDKYTSTGFGSNFRAATIFWLRALMSCGASNFSV